MTTYVTYVTHVTSALSALSQSEPAQPSPAEDRAETFKAVEGGETYSGSALLVEAYAAIWLLLFAWIYLLWRKQAVLTQRLDGLEKTIDRAAAKLSKKGE